MSAALRPLEKADLPFAENLTQQANWNQSPVDWRNFFELPEIEVFVTESPGGLSGTVSVIHFQHDLSWIGLLLVDPAFRNQGLGTLLLNGALERCRIQGSRRVGLDATPAGRGIYEKNGFLLSAELERWTGRAPRCSETLPTIDENDWNDVARFDAERFGTDRQFYLRRLAPLGPSALLREDGTITGFGLARPGRQASYLGPIVATSETAGLTIAKALVAQLLEEPVIWDCFTNNAHLPRSLDLQKERSLYRMLLEDPTPLGQPSDIFAIADPAAG